MAEPRFSSTLLERERETAVLERAWKSAASGHGSLWFLCAEAGGGKTRLATEVAAGIGRGRTHWGAAEPVLPPDPYLAIRRALRPGEGTTSLHESAVEMVAQGTARRLDLAPLSPDAVAAMVADIRRGPVDPAEAAAIHRRFAVRWRGCATPACCTRKMAEERRMVLREAARKAYDLAQHEQTALSASARARSPPT